MEDDLFGYERKGEMLLAKDSRYDEIAPSFGRNADYGDDLLMYKDDKKGGGSVMSSIKGFFSKITSKKK